MIKLENIYLPKNFLNSLYYDKTRKYINENCKILHLIECNDKYIETKQQTVIFIIRKIKSSNKKFILSKQGYTIFGVSVHKVKNQASFSNKFGFPYPLLADTEKVLIDSFGVWGFKKFMGKEYEGILRTTFVFDENTIITKVIDKVKTKDHTSQILDA